MSEEGNKNEKREKRREMILNEIVSSEETYLERLRITSEVYIGPILERGLLSVEDFYGQFGEFEGIRDLHVKLALMLTTAQQEGVLSRSVGNIFLEICPEFGMCKGYLKCFEKALIKRGRLLTSNRKFADYLAEAKANPASQGFSMESLLIEPVQRIPRYRLLLEDLLKNTPEGHSDHDNITAALSNICSIAAENNEAIRQQEELDKVYQVMKQMEYNGSVNLLDNENRKFLKQDDLFRQCRRGRKQFRFWLFNDKLLYGEASTPYILGKFNLNRDLPLNQCQVSKEEENSEFVMRIQSPAKSFLVWFKDREDRDEWVDAIAKCIDECRSSVVSEGVTALAPFWSPDSSTSACAICVTEFSFINRKHHCRNCGCIVCDGCSRSRILLRHVDQNAPVRVCDKCRDQILTDGDKSERSRRHTAQIHINTVYPSKSVSGRVAKLPMNEDVKDWQQKQLQRSQSSGPTLQSRDSIKRTSHIIPATPKPTDKAPPPPGASSSTSTNTNINSQTPSLPPKPRKVTATTNSNNSREVPPASVMSSIESKKPVPPVPPKPSEKPPSKTNNSNHPPSTNNHSSMLQSVNDASVSSIPHVTSKPKDSPPLLSSTKSDSQTRPPPPPPPPPRIPKEPVPKPPSKPSTSDETLKSVNTSIGEAVTSPSHFIGDDQTDLQHSSTDDDSTDRPEGNLFSLKELQSMNDSKRISLMARNGVVNYTEKEMYMTDSDFVKYVGCDKKTFAAWPAWKKSNKRKELGLF